MQHSKTAADTVTPTTVQPELATPKPAIMKPCFVRNTLNKFGLPTDNQILQVLEAETENCKEPEKFSDFFGGGSQEQFLNGIQMALKDWEKNAKGSEAAKAKVPENGDSKKTDPKGEDEEKKLDVNGNKVSNINQ